MEVVCLNSEPVFDEEDEYEDEGDCSLMEHDDELCETQSKKEPPPPTIGLEFDSFDEAYDFYNVYAKGQGFGIRVSNSWFRSKRKERYRAKLSCSSAGFKKKSEANNPRPETRTGCPAMIIIRLVDSKRWRTIEVELEHNHPVSPDVKRFYKSHKKMIIAAKKAQQSEPTTEIHTIKLYRTAAVDAVCNGYSNVDEREGRSPINHSKHLELKEGDAHAVYNYFCRMKLTNPNFFYLMDLDDEGRLKNVFWADARSRAAYSYFCDTIAIDTTCLANKFEIPLISFVGVNHHGQSILLGCGFLGHESVECFVWIFRAWLACMLGHPPQVIITDQSKPLQNAVSVVFPEAHHCYCLWYIMQRVPEKLGGLKGFEAIRRQLNKAVYDSLKIAEFETSWGGLIECHGLGDHKWLQALYEDRQRWVPVYLKDIPSAGMIPIKENEGLTAFFDGYVHKHTSFKEFVDKYDLALQRKHLKEAMGDLESRNSSLELKTRCNFELQLSKVYTKEIFKKFQAEVEGMYSCFNTKQVSVNGPIITYVVKERVEVEGSEKEVRYYEVLYETTQVDIRCICSLFNFKGYLCRHALNVLNYNGVEEIPSRYILPRWCKDFKRRYLLDCDANDDNVDNPLQWYNHLYRRVIQVVEEGAQSQEQYKAALRADVGNGALDRDDEDVYFDDESAEVVISSLRLGDDQGSLFTNSNWFAFQDDRIGDAPMGATLTEMMDEINLNGTSSNGNSSSDDEVVVGEDEELAESKSSSNGTLSSNTNTLNGFAGNNSPTNGDLIPQNGNASSSVDMGFFRFETPDEDPFGDRPLPEWVGWGESSDFQVGGASVNPFEDPVNVNLTDPVEAEAGHVSSPTSGEEIIPNGTSTAVDTSDGPAGPDSSQRAAATAVPSLFEEDVEFVGVELEGTEKAMDQALKEGIVGEAGPLKRNVVPKMAEKENNAEESGSGIKEFNDANYWRVDQEVAVLE